MTKGFENGDIRAEIALPNYVVSYQGNYPILRDR